ncbi:MAG: SH3 domain-containing protein [Eubacterium sp.]|nr:SH3 domain-containing protein [Eubacterium sp.]
MCKRTKRSVLILFCLIAALAVGILSPAGIAVPGIRAENVQAAEYRTTTTALNMRTGAGTNYKVILAIPAGNQVQVLAKPGTWFKVMYNGRTGYVNSKYLRSGATVLGYKTMAEDLNIRSSRSTANRSNIIGVVHKGQTVSVLSIEANLWYYVRANGKTGYIRGGHFTDDRSRMSAASKSSSSTSIKATKTTTTTKSSKKKRVMAEAIKMRSSMSTANNDNVIRIIPKGATVTIKAQKSNNWYKIKYKKKTGYIRGGHFTDDQSRMGIGAVKPYNKVTRTALNLRSTPASGTRTNIITAIPAGRTVTVIGREANNWLKVRYSGVTGFVKNGYFK